MEYILVTGGAGFIGSHLVERLLLNGNHVVCADNFDPYYLPEIKRKNTQNALNSELYHLEECDIRDRKALENLFQIYRFDNIVHLAARAGVRPSIADPLLYQNINVSGTLNLLEICKDRGIRNFIFASSSSVYGSNDSVPFREEDKLAGPVSPYAASKISGELLCYNYNYLYHVPITCLRFFTVYGPRQRPDMAIQKFIRLIDREEEVPVFGDGTSKRDYTYISDIVDGIMAALGIPFGYEIFNLGNSDTVALNHIVKVIERHLGKKANVRFLPLEPGDVPITFADVSKAGRLLGYHPKMKIEEGIENAIKWYRNGSQSG